MSSLEQESAATLPVTGPGGRFRYRWVVAFSTFLGIGLNYADRTAIGLVAPFIIKDFGFSKAEFGLVTAAFFIGYVPLAWLGGYLADRYGPYKVFGVCIVSWSIFVALTGAAVNFFSFAIVRVFFGGSEGPFGTAATKTMLHWFPRPQRGRAFSFVLSASGLGGAVAGPIVIGLLLASDNNWRVPFIVMGLAGLLFAAAWWFFVRDHPELHPWVSEAEKREMAEDRASAALEEEKAAAAGGPDVPSMWYFIRQPIVLGTAAGSFAYAWVSYTFQTWFPVYLLEAQHVSVASLAWASAIPWIGGFLAYNLVGGMLSDWIARVTRNPALTHKWMMVTCLLGITAFMLLAMTATSAAAAVTYQILVLIFASPIVPIEMLLISDVTPKVRYGGVNGFMVAAGNVSGFGAPYVVGLIVDQTGSWPLTFGLGAAISVVAALFLAACRTRTRALEAGFAPVV